MSHLQFTREQIKEIIWQHIDEKGVNGLSKEEIELVKPFFLDLFMYYHENARDDTSSYCHRNDYHELEHEWLQPIFVTGSGRVLCKNCALIYIIDNLSDWRYYLGNIAPGIGPVPSEIQSQGLALQKKIDEQRAAQGFK